jgi:hypothetical protein
VSLIITGYGTVVTLRDRNQGNVAATTYLSPKEIGNARGMFSPIEYPIAFIAKNIYLDTIYTYVQFRMLTTE